MTETRVLAYIDGFNLYYGLRESSRQADIWTRRDGLDPSLYLGRSLYWLDLEAVIRKQLRSSERCVGIKYFSAPRRIPKRVEITDRERYQASNERQSVYFDALGSLASVEVILGWYAEHPPHTCQECGNAWPNFEEKATDVNIATQLVADAYERRFDRAIVLSADSDLVAPIEAVQRLGLPVTVLLAPGRKRAKHLQIADRVDRIAIASIRELTLPETLPRSKGLPDIQCPELWARPGRWVWDDPE